MKTAVKKLRFIRASHKRLLSRSYFTKQLLLPLLVCPLQVMVKKAKLKATKGAVRGGEQDVGWRDGGTGRFCTVGNHL